MQKGLVFFWVGLSVGVLVVSIAACGDSSSTFPEGKEEDASFDTGPGFNLDANTAPDAKQPVVCNPSLSPSFAPVWKPPTRAAGACATEDLGGYYDACLPAAKDQKCMDWIAAHKTCADCIEPADNSGPIQQHNDRYFYTLNVAGCIALVQNATGADQCAAAFDAAAQCRRQSCADCFSVGGTFSNFVDCQSKAAKDDCKSYGDTVNVACVGYKSPDGGAPQCFPSSASESERDHFIRVEGLFCGP